MHSYSLDNQIRKIVFSGLGVVSFLLAGYLNNWVSASFPMFSISFGVIFGFTSFLFEVFLWKALVPFGQILNLNGTWKGQGFSSYKDGAAFETEFMIKQSFTRIEIFSESAESISNSIVAGLHVDTAAREIVYVYENKPKNTSPDDMTGHDGTQRLRLTDKDTLKGDYFSGRDRGRTGTLTLTRSKNGN